MDAYYESCLYINSLGTFAVFRALQSFQQSL